MFHTIERMDRIRDDVVYVSSSSPYGGTGGEVCRLRLYISLTKQSRRTTLDVYIFTLVEYSMMSLHSHMNENCCLCDNIEFLEHIV